MDFVFYSIFYSYKLFRVDSNFSVHSFKQECKTPSYLEKKVSEDISKVDGIDRALNFAFRIFTTLLELLIVSLYIFIP
uniref:Uncharacterized protein n=1 Tax=Arundo donax TaxID=35708 RepID=A0A0A8ZS79_ARUDO